MKIFNKVSIAILVVAFVFGLAGPITTFAATAITVPLGSIQTNNFVIMSKAAITDTPSSVITGNIGAYPIDGASIGVKCSELAIGGILYDRDAAYTGAGGGSVVCRVTNDTLLNTARGDMETAYGFAAGETTGTGAFLNVGAGTLGIPGNSEHFVPGVYTWDTGVTIPNDIYLDGSSTDIWVFQISGTLDISSDKQIHLTGGALAKNIFWQVTGSTTLGTTSVFEGNILDATNIAIQTGATLHGRALAQTAVSLDHAIVTIPPSNATLTLVKTRTNDNGGTAAATDWTLSTTAPSPTIISGATGSGAVTSASVTPGAYTLSESGPSGYTASLYSCVINGALPVVSNSLTLAASDVATCTINNNDNPPILHLRKIIIGGTATFSDFTLTANGAGSNDISGTSPVDSGAGLLADTFALSETSIAYYSPSVWTCVGGVQSGSNITLGINDEATCTITNTYITIGSGQIASPVPPLIDVLVVPNPLVLPSGPGSVTYTYTLRNRGTVPVNSVTLVGDTCSPITLVSGDTNNDSKLDVNETWKYTCATTLSKTHTNTVTATGWANSISAVDLASSTVVVGASFVPPLIHVTKIPSPLALPIGGGMVTYTETVTNPGMVALSNIRLTDDKCSPLAFISGDDNGDAKLDTNETWKYTCSTNLTNTTTNTAAVSGTANGLIIRDFAIVTVIVAPGVLSNPVAKVPVPASNLGQQIKTVVTSYNFGTTTLKNGSKGDAVMELQRFLNAKLNLGLVVDGKLGPKTIAVIKQWQKDNGLVADGLVGTKTKAKMNAQAK